MTDAAPPAGARIPSHQPVKNVRGRRTKQRMLDGAAECFAEYGYTNTRISDIVHRAGVSQGNFYRHFESKAQALYEAVEPALRELFGSVALPGLGDPLDLEVMTRRLHSFLVAYARHRHLLRVIMEAASIPGDDGFQQLWLDSRRPFVDRNVRWLDTLEKRGTIVVPDHELIADMLGAATEQVAYLHIALPAAGPRPEQIQRLAAGLALVWVRTIRGDGPG